MAQEPENFWNLPNMLTGARVLAIPLVILLLAYPGKVTNFLGALSFAAAGATDFFDGWFARRHQLVSRTGKFMDPLADKLLITAALIMLVASGRVAAWMAVVIVGRELAVTGLRALAAADGIILAADRWGKSKTLLQIVALTALILHDPYFGIDFANLGNILMWAALAVTLISGVSYFLNFFWKEPELW